MVLEEDARRGYCYARRESSLKHMLCGGNFLARPPTGRYFLPALPSDCFAIDFPGHAISPSEGQSDIPHFALRGAAKLSFTACIDRAHSDRAPLGHTNDPTELAASSPRGRPGWVPNCARRTTTASSWGFREHGEPTRPPPLYVSIISNRASNSCPQTVQRMQSDSTVNSSARIPMPPQSGQRAR